MDTANVDHLVAALGYQLARVTELREQMAEGLDLLEQLSGADDALQHFTVLYGALTFLREDIASILKTLRTLNT